MMTVLVGLARNSRSATGNKDRLGMLAFSPRSKRALKYTLGFLAALFIATGIQFIARDYQRIDGYDCSALGPCYELGVRSGFPLVYWQGSQISAYSGRIRGEVFLMNVAFLSAVFFLGALLVHSKLRNHYKK